MKEIIINDKILKIRQEYLADWNSFLQGQNIHNGEGCLIDVMGAITFFENLVLREPTENISIRNKLTKNRRQGNTTYSLLDELQAQIENNTLFLPFLFVQACGSLIERDRSYADGRHFNCYRLKAKEKGVYVRMPWLKESVKPSRDVA